jgi:DNA-binding transcriptional MerR regulator
MARNSSVLLRIGSFSRSVGVAPETLRAWEDRYGLPAPSRSSGGFRLYSDGDAQVVAEMKRQLAAGMPASEAARRARGVMTEAFETSEPPPSELDRLSGALAQACLSFDAVTAHRSLDDLLARFSLDTVLRGCVIPFVLELDEQHAEGAITKAQEHFSARLIEGRLLAMASGWELGQGPLALVARGPAERHVVGITALGLALRERGWRIVSLGNAVHASVLADAAAALGPDLVVLSIGAARLSSRDRDTLRTLAHAYPLALGGIAATPRLVASLGARPLPRDVVSAAAQFVDGYRGAMLGARAAG